jgi:hypothetical protein
VSYNAPNYVTTAGKNGDGTDSSDAIELGVTFAAGGTFGHNYWLIFCPYTGGSAANENPNIAYSDDGNTWSSVGFTNPLVPYPGGGASGDNADGNIFDNTSRDGNLYVYWEVAVGNGTDGVYALSYDGATVSSASNILSAAEVPVNSGYNTTNCPSVCYDQTSGSYWLYVMYCYSGTAQNRIWRYTGSSATGPWSNLTEVFFTGPARVPGTSGQLPNGYQPWHISTPIKLGGLWVMGMSALLSGTNPAQIYLASSSDGLTWTPGSRPLLTAASGEWDYPVTYRPALADAGDGANMLLWYTAGTAGNGNTQLSQMVTVPVSEIPTSQTQNGLRWHGHERSQ